MNERWTNVSSLLGLSRVLEPAYQNNVVFTMSSYIEVIEIIFFRNPVVDGIIMDVPCIFTYYHTLFSTIDNVMYVI